MITLLLIIFIPLAAVTILGVLFAIYEVENTHH